MFASIHQFSSRLRGPTLIASLEETSTLGTFGTDLSGPPSFQLSTGVCSVVPLKYNARRPTQSARKPHVWIELVHTGRKPRPEFGLLQSLVLCMAICTKRPTVKSFFSPRIVSPGECGADICSWLVDYAGMTPLRQGFFRCIRTVESISFSLSRLWLLIHQRQLIHYSKHHCLHVLPPISRDCFKKAQTAGHLLHLNLPSSWFTVTSTVVPSFAVFIRLPLILSSPIENPSPFSTPYAHVSFPNNLFCLRPQ